MGCYYLTVSAPASPASTSRRTASRPASSPPDRGLPGLQPEARSASTRRIKLRLPIAQDGSRAKATKEFTPGLVVTTTVGRVIFNDILHPEMPFYNLRARPEAAAAASSPTATSSSAAARRSTCSTA